MLTMAALFCVATPAAAANGDSLGVFNGWAAFRGGKEGRCTALAQPGRSSAGGEKGRAFASISIWPDRRIGGQVHFRLSRLQARGSRIWLSIGERRFALTGGDGKAWAPDDATDRAIIAAMRTVTTMSVEARGADGRAFYDLYVLKGAATAIDAARLGCAGQ